MDQINRIIHFKIPMSICNLRCHYCYLSQRDKCFQGEQPQMKYSPEFFGKAFSKERLGGVAYFNFCADGETMLVKDIDKYIKAVIEQGHYVELISNMTVTKMVDRFLEWDKELLKHIEFKGSFHYLEFKEKGLLNTYADNINRVLKAGASVSVEITPSDELIPLLDEVKIFSMKKFGALPHITIARDDRTKDIDYLTNLSMEEYDKVWSEFESGLWNFKKSIFKVKRKEFCYAGLWSLYINFYTGATKPCYCGKYMDNFYDNIDEPYKFRPIGKCLLPHCFNGHMLLGYGLIPELDTPEYAVMRDRVKDDGSHWINEDLLSFMTTKLRESQDEINGILKFYYRSKTVADDIFSKTKQRIKRLLKR